MVRKGFSMIELSMVILIIGILFGVIVKGKDIYEASKVKGVEGQYNKIETAINAYFTKYGRYPGDGCTSATPATPADCTGAIDNVLTTANEQAAFWYLLINDTKMLSVSDRTSVFGAQWNVINVGTQNYLAFGAAGDVTSASASIACAVDRGMDDGVNTTGNVLTSQAYDNTTDCWSLTGTSTLQINLRF